MEGRNFFINFNPKNMEISSETYIIKRVQQASDGSHTYIVRKTKGHGGNLGTTYVYTESDLIGDLLGNNTFDNVDEEMPELDGQPDNLMAVKVTTTIELVPAAELFTPELVNIDDNIDNQQL